MRDVRIVMMMMKKKKSACLKESASNRPDLIREGKSIAVEHQTEGRTQAEASWQRIAAAGTAQCA